MAPGTVRAEALKLPALGRGPETPRRSESARSPPLRLRVGAGVRRRAWSGAGAWALSWRGFCSLAAVLGPSTVHLPPSTGSSSRPAVFLVTVPLRTERQPPGLSHASPEPRSGPVPPARAWVGGRPAGDRVRLAGCRHRAPQSATWQVTLKPASAGTRLHGRRRESRVLSLQTVALPGSPP